MIRALGAALLMAGPAALGFGAASRLGGRVRDLQGMLAGLEGMRRTLDARLADLEQMLRAAADAAEGRPREVFLNCAEGLRRHPRRSFGALWTAALEELPLLLEPEDVEVLRPLGAVLGRYGGESQCAALEQAAARLGRQLEEASGRRQRLGRVYGAMGLSVGLFLTILLI